MRILYFNYRSRGHNAQQYLWGYPGGIRNVSRSKRSLASFAKRITWTTRSTIISYAERYPADRKPTKANRFSIRTQR